MFCPQCRAEYRDGVTRCNDCDLELADQLPVEPPEHDEGSSTEPVVIRAFSSEFDADLARTALDAAGIESMLRSDDCAGLRPHMALTRGVELLVRSEDAEKADEVLDANFTEAVDTDDRPL